MVQSTPYVDTTFKAVDFTLPDVISGEEVSLKSAETENGFVVVFICNHCPYVKKIIDDLVRTGAELKDRDIPLFAIMSNNYEFVESDSPENMKLFASEHSFSFPYLLDEDQSVAKAYGAVCTPDFFGFNSDGVLQYRGRHEELLQAMLEIKETGQGPSEQQPSQGCSIKWK